MRRLRACIIVAAPATGTLTALAPGASAVVSGQYYTADGNWHTRSARVAPSC